MSRDKSWWSVREYFVFPWPLLTNKKQATSGFFFTCGGACGNQTRDLGNANAALYQLS